MANKNIKKSKSARSLTEATKKIIAGKQYYKCANSPQSNLECLSGYLCPQWKTNEDTITIGSFDESGYEIDHIIEFVKTGDDSENNLQALCKSCHSVKTKRFLMKFKKNKPIRKVDNKIDSNSDKKLDSKNVQITKRIKPLERITIKNFTDPYILPNKYSNRYSDEDLEEIKKYMTESELSYINQFTIITGIIEYMHFNTNDKQYHNIYKSNKTLNNVTIKSGKKGWIDYDISNASYILTKRAKMFLKNLLNNYKDHKSINMIIGKLTMSFDMMMYQYYDDYIKTLADDLVTKIPFKYPTYERESNFYSLAYVDQIIKPLLYINKKIVLCSRKECDD